MRYFLLGFVLFWVAVVGILGFRGSHSRKPPVEIFPDMDRQPKYRPQSHSEFFADNRTSRQPVPGTVVRAEATEVNGQKVFAHQDHPYNTGRVAGSTNYVDGIPIAVNEALMNRGQERYQIFCGPCHGAAGDGKGITSRFGMAVIANLHDPRIVRQSDGELFNVITHGRGLMGSYAGQVPVHDRWAIVAYVRALQRSRLGSEDDVPGDMRAKLPTLPLPRSDAQQSAQPKK
jgi:mono/diheme cytochrome c family protein